MPPARLLATYPRQISIICSTTSLAHGSRIEVEEKCLAWEALAGGLRIATFFSNQVDDVTGVGWVEHRKPFGNAEGVGVSAQSPVRDGVERPSHHAAGHGISAAVPLLGGQHDPGPIQHLASRPPREGQQENAFRRRSSGQQPRHAGRECGRFACSSASKDPKRPTFMADGRQLGLVELLHPGEHMFDSSGSGFREDACPQERLRVSWFELGLFYQSIGFGSLIRCRFS
jgi:hypothetical protein